MLSDSITNSSPPKHSAIEPVQAPEFDSQLMSVTPADAGLRNMKEINRRRKIFVEVVIVVCLFEGKKMREVLLMYNNDKVYALAGCQM